MLFFSEFSITRSVGTKRNDNFYFLNLSAYSNLFFAWKKAIIGFFNFLKIFAIFLEFSFTRWVGMKRNDNFYFLYFLSFSNLFLLEMKPQWYCLIFWFFFFFFLEFFIIRRVWTERKDNFYSLFLSISHPILAWNGAITVFFNLFNFFAIFLEFSLKRQVGTN